MKYHHYATINKNSLKRAAISVAFLMNPLVVSIRSIDR
jgi:hypothetical protein